MTGKSSIDTLPDDVRQRLNVKIGDGTLTIDELTEFLDSVGHSRSRSAVGRHAQKITKISERLNQSKEMAKALVAECGEDLLSSKQGRLINEIFRSIIFDQMTNKLEGEDSFDPQELFFLAKAIKDVAGANRLDQDYEKKVRESIEKEVKEQAADAASATMTEAGLNADQVKFWREEFLGVRKSEAEDKPA